MTFFLFAYNLTGWRDKQNLRWDKNCAIYKTSFFVAAIIIYLAFEDNKAMVICSFNWWDKSWLNIMQI